MMKILLSAWIPVRPLNFGMFFSDLNPTTLVSFHMETDLCQDSHKSTLPGAEKRHRYISSLHVIAQIL